MPRDRFHGSMDKPKTSADLAATRSRESCEACARRLREASAPQGERYALCAELILNTIEEALGLSSPLGRKKSEKALIAILAYYFPNPTAPEPEPEPLSSS